MTSEMNAAVSLHVYYAFVDCRDLSFQAENWQVTTALATFLCCSWSTRQIKCVWLAIQKKAVFFSSIARGPLTFSPSALTVGM